MANSPASPAVAKLDPVNPTTSDSSIPQPTPSPLQSATSTPAINPNSTLNPNPALVSPLPPGIPPYGPPAISGNVMLSVAPSFRPLPQFPGYQNPSVGVQPPGVSAPVVAASGAPGSVPVPAPMMPYQVAPGQNPNPGLRQFAPMPNGFAAIPGTVPQGALPPSVS